MTHEECYACPVGTVFSSLRDVSPDAIAHLAAAAAELARAAEAVLSALSRMAGVAPVGAPENVTIRPVTIE